MSRFPGCTGRRPTNHAGGELLLLVLLLIRGFAARVRPFACFGTLSGGTAVVHPIRAGFSLPPRLDSGLPGRSGVLLPFEPDGVLYGFVASRDLSQGGQSYEQDHSE